MVSPAGFVGEVMSDADDNSMGGLAGDVRQSLHRFLEVYQPLRSDLYREGAAAARGLIPRPRARELESARPRARD
jgi:hypothetical protein